MGNIEFARSVHSKLVGLFNFYLNNSKYRPTNMEKSEYNKYCRVIQEWYENEPDKAQKKEFKQILKELQEKNLTLIVDMRKKARGIR